MLDTSGGWEHLAAMSAHGHLYGTPLWADPDLDGVANPVMYMRDEDLWIYWDSVDAPGTAHQVHWSGGRPGEYPLVMAVSDGDHFREDIAAFDPSGTDALLPETVILREGLTDDEAGPLDVTWTVATPPEATGDGVPLHSRRIQSDLTCGPQSLEMVLRHRGLTWEEPYPAQLVLPRDLNIVQYPYVMGWWDVTPFGDWDISSGGDNEDDVSVGYFYSAGFIVYDALYHVFWDDYDHWPPAGSCAYLEAGGLPRLNHAATGVEGRYRRIDYVIADYDWSQPNPPGPDGIGFLQVWDSCSPRVGTEVGDESRGDHLGLGLAGVANRANAYTAGRNADARVIDNGMLSGAEHFRAIVAGFIDHDIPLVVGVERGGHFNTIVGYWDLGSLFYMYTADPLDGGIRQYEKKPMRWQRFAVTQALLDSGIVSGLLVFDHTTDGGCDTGGWAAHIDDLYGPLLCD